MSDTKNSGEYKSKEEEKLEPVTVWFDDGTLLIKCGETQFKVYAGLLCSKSSIFSDMIELNPRSGKGPLELPDDPRDVAFFLKSIHNTDFFPSPKNGVAAPFAAISGILCVSDKYDVPTLRKRAIEHLSHVYPTTLEEWNCSPHFESQSLLDHIGSIKLARMFDIPWIRPMAIYQVASQPLNTTLPLIHDSGLSIIDFDLCIRGVQSLKSLQFLCTAPIRQQVVMGSCNNPSHCDAVEKDKWDAICSAYDADPLAINPPYQTGFCRTCAKSVRRGQRKGNEVWDMIPRLICKEEWSALTKLKIEALRQ